MKRHLPLIILISLFLIFNSIAMVNALEINDTEINFDISTQELNNKSYVPLNQFNRLENFLMENLQDNRHLIIYKNKHFIISISHKIVKSSQGEFTLKTKPVSLNNHLLVPFELINKIFNNQDIVQEDKQDNKMAFKISTNKKTYSNSDIIELRIKIVNNKNQDITLEFNSGQKYDIYIKNKNGKVIYSWAKNQIFIQTFVSETIEANSKLVYKENIDISDLTKGTYFFEVEIIVQDYRLKAQSIQININ